MKKNIKHSPLAPFTSWKAAMLMGLIGSCAGYGFAMGEVAIATGYRQDSSSFAICAGLASPEYYGFGKARSRDMHIWEIGIGASAGLTDHVYLRSALSYGVILGGRVYDSGIADINSDPLNSVMGRYFTECCAPCECEENICACDCQDKTYQNTVQTRANLFGNVVDFNIALGYSFHPCDDFLLAPVIGWAYNSQRQRWRDSIWGPIQMAAWAFPCPEEDWNYSFPAASTYSVTNRDDPSYSILEPFFDTVADGGQGAQCVCFGECFDGTVYRARWNGPFIGLDLGWALSDVWNISAGYALSYNNYDGKFQTFTSATDQGCNCDLCPEFITGYGNGNSSVVGAFSPQVNNFVPSVMRFNSWGLGQEFSISTDYRCGSWTAGLGFGYTYRNATHCADSDPCESCYTTRNPDAEIVSGNQQYPIWSYAQLTKARWSSFSILATLGYQF